MRLGGLAREFPALARLLLGAGFPARGGGVVGDFLRLSLEFRRLRRLFRALAFLLLSHGRRALGRFSFLALRLLGFAFEFEIRHHGLDLVEHLLLRLRLRRGFRFGGGFRGGFRRLRLGAFRRRRGFSRLLLFLVLLLFSDFRGETFRLRRRRLRRLLLLLGFSLLGGGFRLNLFLRAKSLTLLLEFRGASALLAHALLSLLVLLVRLRVRLVTQEAERRARVGNTVRRLGSKVVAHEGHRLAIRRPELRAAKEQESNRVEFVAVRGV